MELCLNIKQLKQHSKKWFGLSYNCSEKELLEKIDQYKGTTKCSERDPEINIDTHPDYVAAYIVNPGKYNLINSFSGNFIGSIYKYTVTPSQDGTTDLLCPLVVATEQKKDNNTFRCYTLFEDNSVETISDAIKEARENGKKYITPKYVTIVGENGEEDLAFYDGQPISKLETEKQTEAEANYTSFVEEFITPLSGIQRVYIEQFMQNSRDLSDGQKDLSDEQR